MNRRIFKFLFKCQDGHKPTCFSSFKRKILCFCMCSETYSNDIKELEVAGGNHSKSTTRTVHFTENKPKMATPAKQIKTECAKLWSQERRLIGEKFFYLNKSTTKYVIVGLMPKTFEKIVRICDRATGKYISLTQPLLPTFCSIIASIVDASYTLHYGRIENDQVKETNMEFLGLGNGIWKIGDNLLNIQVHVSTLKNFLRIIGVIRYHIDSYDSKYYSSVVESMQRDMLDLNFDDADTQLYEKLKLIEKNMENDVLQQVIYDLICYRDNYAQP